MPEGGAADWKALVRERLDLPGISAQQREEIIAELAGHLDDVCAQYRRQGLDESQAVERVIHEIPDWHEFARRIQRARGMEASMNDRIMQLWLPALAGITAILVLPKPVILSLLHAHMNWVLQKHAYVVIEPITWALGAAIGISLSSRAGGGRLARAACGSVLLALLLAVTYEDCHDLSWRSWQMVHVLLPFFGLRALGLLLGTAPLLLRDPRHSAGAAHA